MPANRSEPIASEPPSANYRIVLEGMLGAGASWFEDAEIAITGTDTALLVVVADQAALHGVLRRIHGLHLKLISVTRVDPETNTSIE